MIVYAAAALWGVGVVGIATQAAHVVRDDQEIGQVLHDPDLRALARVVMVLLVMLWPLLLAARVVAWLGRSVHRR